MLAQLCVSEYGAKFRQHLCCFATMIGGVIPMVTLCSGSDLISPVCSTLFARLGQMIGVPLSTRTEFCCELDPQKREWCMSNINPFNCFGDISGMGEEQAWCYRLIQWVTIPWAAIVFAGFS